MDESNIVVSCRHSEIFGFRLFPHTFMPHYFEFRSQHVSLYVFATFKEELILKMKRGGKKQSILCCYCAAFHYPTDPYGASNNGRKGE